MAKFNAKNLAIVVFLGMLLVVTIGIVYAQQAFPKGEDSFGTAVKLEPGDYQGGGLEYGEPEYFYINVKPGQELKMEGTIKALSDSWGEETLGLYNEDRENLDEIGTSLDKGQKAEFSFSWLSNADKDSYKYYIKRECTWHKVDTLSLNLSLTDRYDAESQTDAGDNFDKVMNISPGEYTAYLSGKAGADTKDFYKTTVQNGETLTVKVTPEGEARMRVAVYDNNRRVLKDEYAPNPGAIITNSVARTKTGDVFIAVICENWCSESVAAYTLNITKEAGAPVGEEEEEEEVLTGESTGLTIGEGLTEEEAEEAAKGFFKVVIMAWLLPLVVGLISLVVVIVVIVVLVRKKKK